MPEHKIEFSEKELFFRKFEKDKGDHGNLGMLNYESTKAKQI